MIKKLTNYLFKSIKILKLGDVLGPDNVANARQYHRHNVLNFQFGSVKVLEKRFPIWSLSWGGVSIRCDDTSFNHLINKDLPLIMDMEIFGSVCRFQVKLVSLQLNQVGFQFMDISTLQEKYLKTYLTYLDAGLILKSVKKKGFDEQYQDPSWYIYGGHEGAVYVFLRFGLNYVLQEAHVLFDYGIKKEIVIYSSSGISVKSSTKEDLSSDKKIRILTRASLILLGMRQIANSEHFDGVLSSAMSTIVKKK